LTLFFHHWFLIAATLTIVLPVSTCRNKRLNLVDFGAAREYNKPFVDEYMRLVWAAANRDEAEIMRLSRKLGFLTGKLPQL